MSNPTTEQYRLFIRDLPNEECRPRALNNIKNLFLGEPPGGEAMNTIRHVGITKIVECLETREPVRLFRPEEIHLACDVLHLCFLKFECGEVVKLFTGHIMYLLRHGESCVRKIAIDEVYKAVTADQALLPVPQYIDVFVAVAQLVRDENVGVANRAIAITSNLPLDAYPKVLEEMKIALEYSSSSKCNAYEVVINLSSKSFELFKLCSELGYVDFMVTELQSSDVLYQLNILELLSQLAIQPHGINYLVKQGALQKISEQIGDISNNVLGNLLIPGYMKFFGNVAHHYPKEMFEKYPALLDCMFDAFDSDVFERDTILPVALDTLGFIGSTIEGKLCLAALGSKYTQYVEKLGATIRNCRTEIKVRALYCFSSLISIEKDEHAIKTGPVDHRVTLMTREWFRTFSTSPPAMESLFEICKNPFPDITLAAFSLLDAVCQHNWGIELVANTAGLIEYLLDRPVYYRKETKEAKYGIIKRLSRSAAFDANIIRRLKMYEEQGPFFSESDLQVAMEEDN